ncbi:MAG: SDR family oxidoreductase [Phycisphaerae bacterium]|nr:SDR family oxidoreductase [Phycisphaerae bacterium]
MSATNRLAGKVAVITGASRGIGRCIALTFAGEGADIVIAAKSDTPHAKLPGTIHTVAEEVEALGRRALPVKVDVRDDGMIQDMVDKTMSTFGRIDILVNNAGALWWQPVLDTPMKRYDLVNDVNSRAAFACTQACLPHILDGGGGHVLVFSPPIDLRVLHGKVAYLISKFGMTMLAIGLAEEMAGKPFSINALWPVTAIETAATINFQLGSPELWRKPEILADATLALVTRPPGQITGRALLDENVLRDEGVTDFSKYQCVPGCEPPRMTPEDYPNAGLIS